jgi:hypothetical protein
MIPSPDGDWFRIGLGNTDTGAHWWHAYYFRSLPFFPNSGWTDGDRVGYSCAYMFLMVDAEVVGRVTFSRVEGAGYATINDTFMHEGFRYYDGTYDGPGFPQELDDCPPPSEAYEPSNESDQRPTLAFAVNGQLVETRDYKTIVLEPGVSFRQTSKTATRITVVAYEKGLPVIVVYYDVLTPNASITSDM